VGAGTGVLICAALFKLGALVGAITASLVGCAAATEVLVLTLVGSLVDRRTVKAHGQSDTAGALDARGEANESSATPSRSSSSAGRPMSNMSACEHVDNDTSSCLASTNSRCHDETPSPKSKQLRRPSTPVRIQVFRDSSKPNVSRSNSRSVEHDDDRLSFDRSPSRRNLIENREVILEGPSRLELFPCTRRLTSAQLWEAVHSRMCTKSSPS
jgi:hypothetical protein